ncbi:ribonuclease HII [Terrarubrum flagellatum]|uniref:ribonuclease HII n=1 Tax=Terrirubrum flagellatum TaxID=2895980 RepID=UPI0031455350
MADEIRPTFSRERALMRAGHDFVAGVDEVGRGPLAGPVVAAAVVLDAKRLPKSPRDSKMLDRAARDEAFVEITEKAIAISVASASALEIDRLNIRAASLLAMRRALLGLSVTPTAALIDGRDSPDAPCHMTPIISGDALALSIAAASIIAKVTRDRLMTRLDAHCPGYGFAQNAGYGTRTHREALISLGPCAYHRMTFAPVKLRLAGVVEINAEEIVEESVAI